MLKKVILVLAALVAALLIVDALQAPTYRVERSLVIAASPADVFAQINDFKKAQAWSPWVKLDPAAKYTFEGPATGVGSANSWAGNSEVGEGRQTIVESRPNELVRLKLEFFKPMAGVATAEFTLVPEGKQTKVTWAMTGEKNFASKLFCLVVSMDRMIGGPFEEGLANLKKLVEVPAKK